MTSAFPLAIAWVAALLAVGIPQNAHAAPRELLWQTNSHGNDIHVVDIERREVVRRLVVGDHPHGIGTDREQKTVFVSLERNGQASGELLWIDPASFEILHRLEIGPEPHQLAVTPDGHFVYVPCRDGHYWVIDARKRQVVAKIRTGGRPHNTTVSSDGRWVYLSPMGEPRAVSVVDVEAGHRIVGRIPFSDSVRPPAIAADGNRFFQHVDGLNGFQVASVAQRRVTRTIRHDTSLGWVRMPLAMLGWVGPAGLQRCHGLAVRPDQREIWSVCGEFLTIHDMTRPDYPQLAVVRLPAKGYWLTFAPERPLAFIALADRDEVAVVHTNTREVAGRIPVGDGPKRNLVVSEPRDLERGGERVEPK